MRVLAANRLRWRASRLVGLLVIALVYSHSVIAASEPEAATSRDVAEPAAAKQESPPAAELAPKSAAEEPAPKPAPEAAAAAPSSAESTSEAEMKRRGRAESVTPAQATSGAAPETSKTATEKPAAAPEKSAAKPESASKGANSKPRPTPPARASPTKSKLPPNLGAVTSTGSGGATHYMSKGDPFQAIEQKHAMMSAHSFDSDKRSDKRASSPVGGLKHFGIQKAGAGGIADYLNPFKVTDNGLARTLGASMRSIIKGKYSVPAYVASALLGAVALMAFYESPMSPLPVPPLPEPPVGRFPPEMPVLNPNTQVPFRPNQGHYNQRSSMGGPQQPMYGQQQQQQQMMMQPQQSAQQVLFPGAQVAAQQRQLSVAPMQQLAANLVPFAKPIQRKSSIEYDTIQTRSSQPAAKPASKPSSFLSFFGLGSSQPQTAAGAGAADSQATSTGAAAANEPKGPQSSSGPGMSNSHLVNKVKSYFNRAGGAPTSAAAASNGADSSQANTGNLYDQYQKMSFVQALMKDTAFIPAFLTSTRKSSGGAQANKFAGPGANVAAARMQVDAPVNTPSLLAPSRQRSGGLGFGRFSDKIAHALLETFASGLVQRSGLIGAADKISARKSAVDDHFGSTSDLAAATGSILSDIISNLNHLPEQQQQHHSHPQQQHQQQQQHVAAADYQAPKVLGEQAPIGGKSSAEQVSAPKSGAVIESQQAAAGQPAHLEPAQAAAAEPLVRKTRSIGFEYPVENGVNVRAGSNNNNNSNNQELGTREPQPNKATQINNVIDFVADSYANNRLLFNFFMNQVGLSQAVPYVEQIFATGGAGRS